MVESQPSKLLVAGSIPVSRSRDLQKFFEVGEISGQMPYQQAQIAVTKTAEFEQLKSALERIFDASAGSAVLDKFYGRLQSRGLFVREFEKALDQRILETVDVPLTRSGATAIQLYESLTTSDQALMREFYLEQIEKVDAKIRQKYQKIYQYY